jgi:hypothetical protein
LQHHCVLKPIPRVCRCTVADLPCSGQQVRLLIGVRRYFCDMPSCARKIFAERLTPFVELRARVTQRLYQSVQVIGLATGGRLGVRVTDRLAIQTTRHSILRNIMRLPTEPVGQVRQIGIDDFSFRCGRKFGTLIVDRVWLNFGDTSSSADDFHIFIRSSSSFLVLPQSSALPGPPSVSQIRRILGCTAGPPLKTQSVMTICSYPILGRAHALYTSGGSLCLLMR